MWPRWWRPRRRRAANRQGRAPCGGRYADHTPKFYYFDIGVKRSLERTLEVPLRAGTYEFGKAFEHFVITQILHLSRYRYPDWRLFYLQTGAGAEIDLVIERPGMPVVLIEIKSSDSIDERDTRGLAQFTGELRPPAGPVHQPGSGAYADRWRAVPALARGLAGVGTG